MEEVIRSELVAAYYLSRDLKCKTITDGSGFGTDNSGYWDIVFDNGRAFLVDDLETKFWGDREKPLKYVKEFSFQELTDILSESILKQ